MAQDNQSLAVRFLTKRKERISPTTTISFKKSHICKSVSSYNDSVATAAFPDSVVSRYMHLSYLMGLSTGIVWIFAGKGPLKVRRKIFVLQKKTQIQTIPRDTVFSFTPDHISLDWQTKV